MVLAKRLAFNFKSHYDKEHRRGVASKYSKKLEVELKEYDDRLKDIIKASFSDEGSCYGK